jgi:transcriptional regulator with XRE-family HTH domain
MGTRSRQRPERLAVKLLAIRQRLGLSQRQLATRIGLGKQGNARVCEYETGVREPPLFALLAYARLAKVCTCVLIDDGLELASKSHKKFHKRANAEH